jgi:hypothetical protein
VGKDERPISTTGVIATSPNRISLAMATRP